MKYKKFIPYGLHEITEEDKQAVASAIGNEWITSGPLIKNFEDAICLQTGSKYCVAVSSGTAALDIAVASLEFQEESEIITTPFTFIATSNSIIYNHCTPVFADIKEDTYCLNPEDVKKKITKKTRAIITVDYAGHPSELEELTAIASKNNLSLIQDSAHSFGAEYKGRKIGTIADLTTFSFHPVKHITTGEGGAVTTNDELLYKKMLCLRNHGIDKDAFQRFGKEKSYVYDMKYLGKNYRITDFQCALGLSQLKRLEAILQKRKAIAEEYTREFSSIKGIQLPVTKNNARHAWHLYPILVPEKKTRDDLFYEFRQKNIGVNVHYIPVYKHTYYREHFNFKEQDFPVVENVFKRELTLPLHPLMKEEDVEFVINSVKSSLL